MDGIIKLDNISQFNALRGIETFHPLISVFESSKMKLIPEARANYGFYCVFLKEALDDYLNSEITQTSGLPTVKYCADQLHISPNHFGDMIKKEIGKSALDHIQLKLIEIVNERVFDPSKSIGEIAYELGFKHPKHFSRMFKNETGHTPNEYRSLN